MRSCSNTQVLFYCKRLKDFVTPELLELVSLFQVIAWLLLATSPTFIALGKTEPTLPHKGNSVE